MRSLLLLAVFALGCGGYARTDVLTGTPGDRPGECLDLRIEPHADEYTNARGWPAVRYSFGNPCQGATDLHLGRAEIWWHGGAGAMQLHPFDPRDELRAGLLDGGQRSHEVIAYTSTRLREAPDVMRTAASTYSATEGGIPGAVPPGQICVHVSQIAADAAPMSAHCFDWNGGWL